MAVKTTCFKYNLGGGQLAPDLGGPFDTDRGGQLQPGRGGHIDRIFHQNITLEYRLKDRFAESVESSKKAVVDRLRMAVVDS